MDIFQLLETPLPGGTLRDWLATLAASTLIVLGVYLCKPIIVRRLTARAQRTAGRLDDAVLAAVRATRLWLVVFFAISVGSQSLELESRVATLVGASASLAFFLQLGLWLSALLRYWFRSSQERALQRDAAVATSLSAIGFLAEIVLWAVILLVSLDNLGVNVTALVAGLGVGGIAVALAVQNILSDLFASMSIVIDKPFVIGDFIIVDGYMGTVEHIGLKTTRVRSLDGEMIIFSNSDLLKARVKNYKRMYERRVVFTFSMSMDTPAEALARVPAQVRAIVETQKKARFERSHMMKFGERSFDFETVYWVEDPDYNLHMDIQQNIHLSLLRAFEGEGLCLANARNVVVRQAEPSQPGPPEDAAEAAAASVPRGHS